MDVAIVGAGYVGVATGLALAEHGHHVILVDKDEARIRRIAAGEAPFHEEGIDTTLRRHAAAGTVRATMELDEALERAPVTFLAVGTPSGPDGAIDLSHVEAAAHSIGKALAARSSRHTIVVKSTVVPGTTEGVVKPALEEASGRKVGRDLGLAVNPEFLREGAALADALNPDRIVVGEADKASGDAVAALYTRHRSPVLRTTLATAEAIKYVSNALLALKVGFANEMANLCERAGVDVDDVMRGVGLDKRVGPHFLDAGAGFGGSCFPKDVRALAAFGRAHDAGPRILDALLASNDAQPLRLVEMVTKELGDLEGKRVALLGVAFKPGTDDVRESRAIIACAALRERGAAVIVHDPAATGNFLRATGGGVEEAMTADAALDGADACVIVTAWPEYARIPPALFKARMRTPVVVDARRLFDPAAMAKAGVTYRAIGRPRQG